MDARDSLHHDASVGVSKLELECAAPDPQRYPANIARRRTLA
jgi:hypothetical protein